MLNIIKYNYKMIMSNRATMWYIIIYCGFSGVFVPLFWKDIFFTIVLTLNFSFVVQIGPRLFVEEKENATLETIISTPISMKNIFMGKVWFCFGLILVMLYASFLIAFLLSLIFGTDKFAEFQIKEVLVYFFLIPVSLFTLSYHTTFLSLKSDDSRACALYMILVTGLYCVLPISIFTCINMNQIVLITIICFYMIVNLLTYFIISKWAKPYFNKATVLTFLSKAV